MKKIWGYSMQNPIHMSSQTKALQCMQIMTFVLVSVFGIALEAHAEKEKADQKSEVIWDREPSKRWLSSSAFAELVNSSTRMKRSSKSGFYRILSASVVSLQRGHSGQSVLTVVYKTRKSTVSEQFELSPDSLKAIFTRESEGRAREPQAKPSSKRARHRRSASPRRRRR